MDPVRHLKNSILVLFILVTLGTVGYVTIERWRPLDALYMTVITLSTVGFREVHDLSDAGKVFTVFLIVFGVSVLGYLVGSLAQIMFEGQFQRIIGRKKVEKMVEAHDTLIDLGEPEAIQKLEQLINCEICADSVINKHRGEPHRHE